LLRDVPTVTSGFLAKKAFGKRAELIDLIFCSECGFRFYDRGLSDVEAGRYYDGYRSEEYYKTRHEFEIFYTRRAHDETGKWLNSDGRKVAVASVLETAGAPRYFASALDFGGGTGHMLLGLDSGKRAVFDLSKEEAEPGVESYGMRDEIPGGWNLILSCQVLEHLSDPLLQVSDMARLLLPGGWLYIEVPNQTWRNIASPKAIQRAWLSLLLKSSGALHLADFICTAIRVKLGFVPPLGFVPMREHINFFTEQAVTALLQRAGLEVRWSGRNSEQAICAVATRGRNS
jgi:SAM-dependent methyltransferase